MSSKGAFFKSLIINFMFVQNVGTREGTLPENYPVCGAKKKVF